MDRVDQELAGVGALLVDDRVLRRIIKRDRGIPGLGLQVPHAHAFALSRAALTAVVDADEVGAELAALPEHVVAIGGLRAELTAGDADAWSRAWRTIFHGRVHEAFDRLLRDGALGAAGMRERINRIGQTEFDEIRLVLQQEDLLLPPADDTATYVEFVALYLELRHFAPRALERTFPTLHDAARVDATIERDVDPRALLAASRPPRAPAQPIIDITVPPGSGPPRPRPMPMVGRAGRSSRAAAAAARARGNHARAAILSFRAGDPDRATADLDALVARLATALGAGVSTETWAASLAPVAQFAAGQRVRRFTAGARLLHDLQAACVVAERDSQVVDVVTWATSFGRRPVVRALPATREIRVAKHLHAAAGKIARCELGSADERERLAAAVHAMVERGEHNVRTMMRPKIEEALDEVELRPRQLPERVAQKKIVDELLDQAVAVGRLSIGNLRDAISHNELKLPDLRPTQLVTGDPLLKADRILAGTLDGVYRRGEIYLRFLQKISSVLSGVALGRLLSLYILLPAVGSFFLVEGLQHVIGPIAKHTIHLEPEFATRPVFALVGVFLFLLLHSLAFREQVVIGLRRVWSVLRIGLVDLPRALWRVPGMRPLTRWVIAPALPAAPFVLFLPGLAGWIAGAIVFVIDETIMHSAVAEELVSDLVLRSGRQLSQHILPVLFHLVIELFAWLIELTERGIYRIDELLRFRAGQSRLTLYIKGTLGTIWFFVAYFLRLYVNLFIEPEVNPIKHFPTVTVAAKLTLPFSPQMISAMSGPLSSVLGPTLGGSFAAFTVFVIPGLAGFLAWELNGNWKLYGANRADTLDAVKIGHHGETMVRFMRPGLHSGTIPKLHAKLRRAAWKGNERGVAKHREGLHHVEDAIWKFADRQLVSMLNEALSFRATDVAVHHVEIGSNRVRIELVCPSVKDATATIAFEQQSGWLVASLPARGWIDVLDPEQRGLFELALAGFYKLSGVDLVREQLEAVIGAGVAYDVADEGLVVWPGAGFDTEVVYDLEQPTLPSVVRGAPIEGTVPALVGAAAFFGREPIRWVTWATTWEHLAFGMAPKPILAGPSLLGAPAAG